MIPYATLDYIKAWLKTEIAATNTLSDDDRRLLQASRVVSRRIDGLFASLRRPLFAPWIETRNFPLDGTRINSWQGTFSINGYLLALTSLSVAGTVVTGVEGYPDSTMPPFPYLRLTDCCNGWYGFCSDCCDPQQVSISGVWGFSGDFAHAWSQVDVLAAAITTATATTLTVADVDGEDAYGIIPRISAGNLLKVEDEYLEVTATNPSNQTVTVIRGAHGSTAAAHVISTPVYRWDVEPAVQHAVARQVGLMYSRRGAYTTMEVQGMSEVRYPSDWLAEVYATMQGYANA